MPFEAFRDNHDVGRCFVEVQIGHQRDNEGYRSSWFDVIDSSDGDEYLFEYELVDR